MSNPTRTISFDTTEDRHDREERTYREHGRDATPCLICGRQTDGSRSVHVTDGYGSVVHPDDAERELDENQASYMGVFYIGPTCQRKAGIPDEFVT